MEGQSTGVLVLQLRLSMVKKCKLSTKAMLLFYVLALIVSEILTFEIFCLKQVGQGHGILLSQWRQWIPKSLKVI